MTEAATTKTRVQRLLRDLDVLLADRAVPARLKKEIRDVRTEARRTWADLADEANGDETMELGKIARVRIDPATNDTQLQDFVEAAHGALAEPVSEMDDLMPGYALSLADLRSNREAYELQETAEKLFSDFNTVVRSIWYADEVPDKGAAILVVAKELAGELGNLQNLAAESVDILPIEGEVSIEEDDMEVEEVRTQIELEEVVTEETVQLCESFDGAQVLSLIHI